MSQKYDYRLYTKPNRTPLGHSRSAVVGDLGYPYASATTGIGQLIIPPNSKLEVIYDAEVAHNIAVLFNELQIDRLQEVPAHTTAWPRPPMVQTLDPSWNH